MQISIRQTLQFTAWVAFCITVVSCLEDGAEKLSVSPLLCGLTLFQLPLQSMFGSSSSRTDESFEHFVCVAAVGVVGSILCGIGVTSLAGCCADKISWLPSNKNLMTPIGWIAGTSCLSIFLLIHVVFFFPKRD